MSGANAIHGDHPGRRDHRDRAADVRRRARRSALVAVVLATVNMVGGFVVTDRMLEMFKGRKPAPASTPTQNGQGADEGPLGPPSSCSTCVAAVCFILALKGLSSPATARHGNLIGAAGAALAVRHDVLLRRTSDTPRLDPRRDRGRPALGVPAARRVQMTQMPQLVALFNGVGGGAAALVALLELRLPSGARSPGTSAATSRRSRSPCSSGASRSPARCVTFAKLQELMTTRPVVVPGARRCSSAALVGARSPRSASCRRPRQLVASALLLLLVGARCSGVLFVLPVGGADVPIVISLLNAFTGLTVAAERLRAATTRCCSWRARWSARAARSSPG